MLVMWYQFMVQLVQMLQRPPVCDCYGHKFRTCAAVKAVKHNWKWTAGNCRRLQEYCVL